MGKAVCGWTRVESRKGFDASLPVSLTPDTGLTTGRMARRRGRPSGATGAGRRKAKGARARHGRGSEGVGGDR